MKLPTTLATLNLALSLPLIAVSFDAAAATGRVPILWSQPEQVQLVPQLKLYPGVSLDVVVSGQVDVDHRFGERRRCKYFGAKCWFEKWDKPHWIGPDGLDLEIAAQGASVTRTANVYRLALPLAAGDANYHDGVDLRAMLWLSGNTAPASRAPCIGRPSRCSGGDVTITLRNIDVAPRLAALESWLSRATIDTLDVDFLKSEDHIDTLLYSRAVASDTTITRLVSILTRAAERLRATIPGKSATNAAVLHMKIIDLASYADTLPRKTAADAATLRILIAESHFDRNDFTGAGQEAPKMMEAAKKAFDANHGDVENARLYARALKVNASAWREKQARNSSADIRVAIALLDQASEVLTPFTAETGVSKLISDIKVDAARMLNVLRTEAELQAAEQRLVAAICYQLHAEQGNGAQFATWRAGISEPSVDCREVDAKK